MKAPSGDALRDELTRLPDRALLREHLLLALARAKAQERELAVLHLGVDDFKLVNDSLGRAAGDQVLRDVAHRLEDLTGPAQVVARAGSDEFILLLPDLVRDVEQVAEATAGQVAAALSDPFTVDGERFELTASIGASLYPRDASDCEAVLKHAETAMYEAKGAGRGGFAVYAGGTQDAYERLVMPMRLRDALEHDRFVLHYQPIVSPSEGGWAYVEALLRYCDPVRGMVPPLKFLPVAEYTRLIEPIGDWVIDAVCRQIGAWREAGTALSVSLNLSLGQIRRPGLAGTILHRLERHRLEPASLLVEITESTAMQEWGCVEPTLRELHEAGVRVAMDDFGTGYSSLSRLRQMPLDVVKLDRSLLAGAPADDGARRLVAAAIALIRAVDMVSVAEGVESEEQLAFLIDERCDLVQGFHLAVPMNAEMLESRLPATPEAWTRNRNFG